jgi:hypothetical protein
MHEEIKSRLNSENACYNPVQSLLSSRLLSRNVNVKIYKTINLPAVLCGCETSFPTSKEEHRVLESRVLRRIYEPKRDEVTGESRQLQIKSRKISWAGHVACTGEERRVYKVLVGKTKGQTTRKTKM